MNLNGVEYYYIRNAQGDIIGLFDKNGATVASYVYDSWGKLISIKDGSGTDITNNTSSVGYKNLYRYRGYRYDIETGLYYLQSRYYNPEWGRFINADGLVGVPGELLTSNMFAYCMNNPVNMTDPSGQFAFLIPLAVSIVETVAAVVTAVIVAAPVIINEVSMIVSAYGPQLVGAAQNLADKISGDSKGNSSNNKSNSSNNGGNKNKNKPRKHKSKTNNSNWGNQQTLQDHFDRHGKDFNVKTPQEYARKANDFYNNRNNFSVKVDNKGVTRVYDPRTNTFGSYNPNGTTRTFYKPKSPTYWDRQPGR